jgi:hypothetical protein
MPQPTQSQVHVDQLLTNMLVGYKNLAYIADDAAPIVPVDKQTNIIPRLNQSYFFRDDAKLRAPGTESAGGGLTVDNTLTYYCPRYSYSHDIPDEVRDNTDAPYDQDREAAMLVADKLQMARERSFAANIFTTGIWGTNKVAGTDFNQWSNYAGSTPLEDVTSWKDQVEALVGVEPNVCIIGKQVLVGSGGVSNGAGLIWHPELIDTIKYTQRGQLSVDLIASLFGFEKFLIGRAIFTSTPEGTAETSVSYSRIWGKNLLMYYNTPGPSIWKPTAIQTIVWNRVANAVQYIKRMRIETKEIDRLEGNTYFTQKTIVTNAGLFAGSVVN